MAEKKIAVSKTPKEPLCIRPYGYNIPHPPLNLEHLNTARRMHAEEGNGQGQGTDRLCTYMYMRRKATDKVLYLYVRVQ